MSVKETIQTKLQSAISTTVLDVTNESHMHNVPKDSETHFRVVIVSDDFDKQTLVARHRSINKLLAQELSGGVHALALHTFTPQEWQDRNETATASPACKGGSAAESS